MNFTFTGCSLTVGVGLEQEKLDVCNYTNIVSSKFNVTPKNLASGGNSNYNIFISALNELINSPPDKLFVQWSGLNRLWLYPGPDTSVFLSMVINQDYHYRDLHFTKKELQQFFDYYHILP